MFNTLWSHLTHQDRIETGLFVISLIFFWFVPLFMNRVFAAFEAIGTRLARRKHAPLLAIASAVVVLRLCALPLIPVPFPQVQDEFSYLLAGDTFAHARLTNPPHQMWIFFDTIHVNQHPTYMSKYPPAQGAVLALGEILGHPWIGVLLSCVAMCAACLWALQGWLPPQWALLGAVILLFRLALFSYWINSYWGGAVAATGGALVIGAFPRILRRWRSHDAIVLGLGIAILANSRPFEGLVFCVPVALGLILAVWKKRTEFWQRAVPRLVIPLCVVGGICGVFMAYYNVRGTGHPFLFPYTINDRTYLTTPIFGWQTPREPFQHSSPQLDKFYNGWSRDSWFHGRVNSFQTIGKAAVFDVATLTYFYLWPELCFVAPALLLLLRDKKFHFVLIQLIICVVGFLLVPWFMPHYAAPLVGALFVAITQGLRHVRHWNFHGRPVGVGLSRVIVLFVVLVAPILHFLDQRPPEWMHDRDQISTQLKAAPGDQLVIVHYSDTHSVHSEWVYNDADIDRSKVVWARDIPGVALGPLFAYFHARRVWLVEPDVSPARLTLFSK
jgi:hypothetical protein